ncbi:hypothetical protein HDU92_001701 [Lobulomyces angularis]|nr:hypothetical protein HDU92_001701 [Lobulomyces angularis]
MSFTSVLVSTNKSGSILINKSQHTPKSFLLNQNFGAYTVIRTKKNSNIVDYNFHFNRLKLGAEELFNFALTVDDKKKIFFLIKNCIEEFYKQILQIDIPNSSTEIEAKVTILIFKDETENMKIICLCDTFKENKLPYCKILLGGKPRSLPMVKASQWVLDRVKFDDLVVSPIHEVVLMDDSNDIFEGLTSNFCVLTTNDSNFDPQNAVDFSMFTIISAPQDQVLPGSMISLVSSACKKLGIQFQFKFPNLKSSSTWCGCFLASTTRNCVPIKSIQSLNDESFQLNFEVAPVMVVLQKAVEEEMNSRLLNPLPSYTWKQVSTHCTRESCWVIYEDSVFDVTPFLEKHPGGVDLLLLGGGRDTTNLIPSYHWWTDKPQEILKKFKIGKLEGRNEFPSFPRDTGFYRDLTKKVGDYFKKTNKDPKDPLPGIKRLLFMFVVAFFSYLVMHKIFFKMDWNFRLLAAVIYGIFQALPLLHQMHDASHTAIGHTTFSWTFFSHITMDIFAGASINSWLHQHVLSHHLYTNISEVDADLPIKPTGDIRRITKFQRWSEVYKLQFLYLPVLYSLLGIKFRIQDIVNTLIEQKNGVLRITNINTWHVIEQILVKTFFVFWRLYLPVYYFNINFKEVLILFTISELMTGLWLSWNFQVSHVSPIADFYEKEGEIDEWAKVQVRTSIDYAHGNALGTFLCGALNYQIEHHLFPSISQYHYPAIAPIVMEVCKQHNVKYNLLPSFTAAFKLHLHHLYNLGSEPSKVKSH